MRNEIVKILLALLYILSEDYQKFISNELEIDSMSWSIKMKILSLRDVEVLYIREIKICTLPIFDADYNISLMYVLSALTWNKKIKVY